MEGTRHEKVALVVVAYIIGAVTVFIGSSSNNQIPAEPVSVVSSDQVASVIATTPAVRNQPVQSSIARYADRVLTVTTPTGERTLSFSVEDPQTIPEQFLEQGAHVGNLIFHPSITDEFIFFCEEKVLNADTCNPFVYDVLADVIHPLRLNGERITLLVSAANQASWTSNRLTVGNESSTDPLRPWALGVATH